VSAAALPSREELTASLEADGFTEVTFFEEGVIRGVRALRGGAPFEFSIANGTEENFFEMLALMVCRHSD
jgi:hypothetical protein